MGEKTKVVLLLFLIILVSVATHLPTLRNGFTNLDDPQIILDNTDIRGLSLDHMGRLFTKSYGGLGGYTPLVLLSYAVEYRFFGLDPRGFHATNLILHVGNTLLVFWLMCLVGGGIGVGFVSAVFFAIHPLHVEPIAWVQGRKDLLFSLFYLSGLIAYIRFIQKGRKPVHYGLSLLLFSLSLFSKVTAMSFPLVVLLLEKHFAGKIGRSALVRSLPFWGMSGLFFVLSFLTHEPLLAQTMTQPPGYLQDLGRFFYAFAFYAGKVFAPFGLFPGYSLDIGHHPWHAVLNFAALAALAAICYYAYRRKPGLVTFSIGFAVLSLLPTLPFHFLGQPYEDRYMYLPLAGILFVLAGLLSEKVFALRPLSREAAMAWPALLLIGSFLGVSSWNQGRIWHDSVSLWSHVVEKDPSSIVGYANRAEALESNGELSKAMADYDKSQLLAPMNPWIALHKAGIYFKQRAYEKTLEELNRLLSQDPLFYDGYMSRGMFWSQMKEFDKAVLDFTIALKLNKSYQAYCYRAQAYIEEKEFDQALEDLRSAYRIEPTGQVRDLITKLSSPENREK